MRCSGEGGEAALDAEDGEAVELVLLCPREANDRKAMVNDGMNLSLHEFAHHTHGGRVAFPFSYFFFPLSLISPLTFFLRMQQAKRPVLMNRPLARDRISVLPIEMQNCISQFLDADSRIKIRVLNRSLHRCLSSPDAWGMSVSFASFRKLRPMGLNFLAAKLMCLSQ